MSLSAFSLRHRPLRHTAAAMCPGHAARTSAPHVNCPSSLPTLLHVQRSGASLPALIHHRHLPAAARPEPRARCRSGRAAIVSAQERKKATFVCRRDVRTSKHPNVLRDEYSTWTGTPAPNPLTCTFLRDEYSTWTGTPAPNPLTCTFLRVSVYPTKRVPKTIKKNVIASP